MDKQQVIDFLVHWVPIVISAAAAAMAVLPQGKPGSTWDSIRSVVNWLALNVGNAKNIKK